MVDAKLVYLALSKGWEVLNSGHLILKDDNSAEWCATYEDCWILDKLVKVPHYLERRMEELGQLVGYEKPKSRLLNDLRETIFGHFQGGDSRLRFVREVDTFALLCCLNLIKGFGVNYCKDTGSISTIKTLRMFADISLMQAKYLVQVFCEACEDDETVHSLRKDFMNKFYPNQGK